MKKVAIAAMMTWGALAPAHAAPSAVASRVAEAVGALPPAIQQEAVTVLTADDNTALAALDRVAHAVELYATGQERQLGPAPDISLVPEVLQRIPADNLSDRARTAVRMRALSARLETLFYWNQKAERRFAQANQAAMAVLPRKVQEHVEKHALEMARDLADGKPFMPEGLLAPNSDPPSVAFLADGEGPRADFKNAARAALEILPAELRAVALNFLMTEKTEALEKVSEAARRYSDPNRSIGDFMFLGPTRAGKTEVAPQLANSLDIDELSDNLDWFLEADSLRTLPEQRLKSAATLETLEHELQPFLKTPSGSTAWFLFQKAQDAARARVAPEEREKIPQALSTGLAERGEEKAKIISLRRPERTKIKAESGTPPAPDIHLSESEQKRLETEHPEAARELEQALEYLKHRGRSLGADHFVWMEKHPPEKPERSALLILAPGVHAEAPFHWPGPVLAIDSVIDQGLSTEGLLMLFGKGSQLKGNFAVKSIYRSQEVDVNQANWNGESMIRPVDLDKLNAMKARAAQAKK